MTIVGIICEYNPFHNGHLSQIRKIKEKFGDDCLIVCVMSGNFTQRGEVAIIDKYKRAGTAVDCGASLVLELPYPYSCACAEIFAESAVSVLDRLGAIDYLCFGSECGNTEKITETAELCLSDEFNKKLSENLSSGKNVSDGYASVFEKTYKYMFTNQTDFDIMKGANNILGIEYVKSLIRLKSKIMPITFLRNGDAYNEKQLLSENPSASAVRAAVYSGNLSESERFMPSTSWVTLKKACDTGHIACYSNLSAVFLSSFRLKNGSDCEKTAECGGGLGNRIISRAYEVSDTEELIESVATKKYTNARIRRAMLYLLTDIDTVQYRTLPEYTSLLAADSRGTEFLSLIRKTKSINILTKPADYVNLPEKAKMQAAASIRADSIYSLAFRKSYTGNEFLKRTPYIKK